MKLALPIVAFIAILILFSGCTNSADNGASTGNADASTVNGDTDTGPKETFLIGLKYNENEELTNQVTISANSGTKKMELKNTVLTLVKEVKQGNAKVEAVLLKSIKTIDGNATDNCGAFLFDQKYQEYSINENGVMEIADGLKTSFYLPNAEKGIDDNWEFEGITYKIEKKLTTNFMGKSIPVLQIGFNGIRENSQTAVDGWALFDYENGRVIRTVSNEMNKEKQAVIKNSLIKVEKFDKYDFEKACIDAKYTGD